MIIVGYFSTSQQVTYGKNKAGNIIYLVNSLNSDNKKYLVSYGGKLKGKIIIIFNKINNNDLPKGQIIDIIGLMNDSNLLITLQYIYNINRKNLSISNLSNNFLLKNIINKYIFSIDPPNCNDIDDALSFEENEEYYIVGVYIAQPICWLSEELLMNRLKNSFSTLYNDIFDNNNNLWGNTITELSSLSINQEKNAYCIYYYINKNTFTIDKIDDFSFLIINKLQTNYEECFKYDNINKLYELSKLLIKKNNFDSHDLVSYWMIKTNNYIGNKYKYLSLPYRVMKYNNKILESDFDNFNNINDINVKDIFINKISDSAYYSLDDFYHYKLDIYNYIHFTSPIRRIIDTLIHWCIYYNINFKELLNKYNYDIDHINNLDKSTRKYHNNIKLLKNINNLDFDKTYNGWIYKISIEKLKINVYFVELGFINVKIDESYVDTLIIGNMYEFNIYEKNDFLPYNKIFIKLIINN